MKIDTETFNDMCAMAYDMWGSAARSAIVFEVAKEYPDATESHVEKAVEWAEDIFGGRK